MTGRYRLSGDLGVGEHEPPDVRTPDVDRLPVSVLMRLRAVRGLVSTASDVLDEAGWSLSVPASELAPRHATSRPMVGHALTLRYLPSRHHVVYPGSDLLPPRLAHHVVYRLARPGDVMVIDASATRNVSTMGGLAATAAVSRGLSGAVVDGGVRDLAEIVASGLALWSRYVTPRCGKGRLDGVAVNAPVSCADVQVVPGDLVLADATGICFVPSEFASQLAARVFDVTDDEALAFDSALAATDE